MSVRERERREGQKEKETTTTAHPDSSLPALMLFRLKLLPVSPLRSTLDPFLDTAPPPIPLAEKFAGGVNTPLVIASSRRAVGGTKMSPGGSFQPELPPP